LKDYGWLEWCSVGIITALLVSLLFLIIKTTHKTNAITKYYNQLNKEKSQINPLDKTFENQILAIENLRLPANATHTNKSFTNCTFLGPGTMALTSGHFHSTTVYNIGDIICVPENTRVTGAVRFENCQYIDCTFVDITLITTENQGEAMKSIFITSKVTKSNGFF